MTPLSVFIMRPKFLGLPIGRRRLTALLRDKQFDLAILSSPRRGATMAWESLVRGGAMPPLILLDGEDDPAFRRALFERHRCALYFKREYRLPPVGGARGLVRRWRTSRADAALAQRTYPLPLAVALDTLPTIPIVQRDVDVSYAARISHPKRLQAVELLQSGIRGGFHGGVYAEAEDRQSKLLSGVSRLLIKLAGDPPVTAAQRGTKLSKAEYYALLGRSK
ncbi:hypothetical protein EMGBD2_15390, partial [Nitrospirota bacterium]